MKVKELIEKLQYISEHEEDGLNLEIYYSVNLFLGTDKLSCHLDVDSAECIRHKDRGRLRVILS